MLKKSLIKAALKVGLKIILVTTFTMKKYAKHKDKYSLETRYNRLRNLGKDVLKALGGEATIIGKNNIPNEVCFFACNHIDNADPLIIFTAIEKPTAFVCKKEVKKFPFVPQCVESIDGEYIDREDLKASLRTMMKVETDFKERNKNWLIFPEGTRNKDNRAILLPFHHGTFRPAIKAEVPIVPVAIYGTQRVLSSKYNFNKYPIYIEFGKPIYPKDYEGKTSLEVANKVQSIIQTMVSYHARKADKEALATILGDKYNENY